MEMFKPKESFLETEKRFLKYAAPTCMLIVSPFGLAFVTIMFAGWDNKELLSGVALGNTTYNIFMMSFMCGFCSLLSTYGPQIYGSNCSKNYLGMVVQKVFLIGLVVFMLSLGPYLKSLDLISWIIRRVNETMRKRDLNMASTSNLTEANFSEIQEIASEFIRKTWIWGMLDFSMRLLTKYLSLQYRYIAVYSSSALLMALHTVLSYIFTAHLNMGLDGLVFAGTLSRAISLGLLIIYCCLHRKSLAWCGFTTKILENWKDMVVLGLSASVNVFCEMGMYELAIFLSQFRGINYLSSVVISFQIITLIYSTTYGICYASAAMIGTALGERDAGKVVRYMKLCLANTVVESILLAVVSYLLRYQLVGLFTNDPRIIQDTTSILWIILFEVPLDHIQTLFSYGILVTVGSQVFVATALAVICYGVCTPVIIYFIFFTTVQGEGVLWGMVLFVSLSGIVCGAKVWTLDINNEIDLTKDRVESSFVAVGNLKKVDEDDTDESLLESQSGDPLIPESILNFDNLDLGISIDDLRQNIGKATLIIVLLIGWTLYFLAGVLEVF